jgi:hypothetical protein
MPAAFAPKRPCAWLKVAGKWRFRSRWAMPGGFNPPVQNSAGNKSCYSLIKLKPVVKKSNVNVIFLTK